MMSKDKLPPAEPVTTQQSIGQTILVVFLVLAVGLIFGIGQSSITMAMDGKAVVEVQKGITNVDYKRYARIESIIKMLSWGMKPQDVENQQWDMFYGRTYQEAVRYTASPLVLAKLGENEGMKPSGDKLKAIVNEFLSTKLPGGDYPTLGAGIAAVIKADVQGRTVTPIEIQEYIASQRAAQNYMSRYAPNIVVNKSAAGVLKQLDQEKVQTEEATISVAAIVNEFKEAAAAEQETLEAKYEDIKDERFLIPRRCQLTAIGADVNSIKQALVITDEEIGNYYTANKETDPMLKKPAPAVAPKEGEAPPAPSLVEKTLDESRAYIRGQIESEKAEIIAIELCDQFANGLLSEGLIEEEHIAEGKMEDVLALAASVVITAADERLSKDVALQVWKDLGADEPQDGKTYAIQLADGKHFANMEVQNPSLFDKEVLSVFLRAQAHDNKALHLFQIVNGFTEKSNKPYDEVKDEVILLVSAEKAYPTLLEHAQTLLAEAAKASEPNLTKFFAQSKNKKWAAQIESKSYGPLESILPPEGADGFMSPIIAFTQAGKEFYLSSALKDGDMQRITLSRVVGYGVETEDPAADNADRYISELKRTVSGLNNRDLGAIIDADLNKE